MPTGYTYGVIEGKIKDFPEFAKTCMRAFGATIHLRDEPLDKEYEPRVPCDYHSEELSKGILNLETAKTISDEELIAKEFERRSERKEYLRGQIKKIKEQKIVLEKMLKEVTKWTPPTHDHINFKNFMVEQLQSTIDRDGSTEYYDIELKNIDKKTLDAKAMRQEMIDDVTGQIEYHTKEYKKELERCNESNKWVNDLLKSLKQYGRDNTK